MLEGHGTLPQSSESSLGELITGKASWSDHDRAICDAAKLHRRDGYRVASFAGAGGAEEIGIELRLQDRRAAMVRLEVSRTPQTPVEEGQQLLRSRMLKSIVDCLNGGVDPSAMLRTLSEHFEIGAMPIGFSPRDARLIDIRVDDVAEWQWHYELPDDRYMIWSDGVYIEVLSAAEYLQFLQDEQDNA